MHSKLEIYVPSSHAGAVKAAIAAAGAGKLGNYDCCIWETAGRGQFRPLPGSAPFAGKTGELEFADEIKLETICETSLLPAIIRAMRAAHPYETPAFQFFPVETDV